MDPAKVVEASPNASQPRTTIVAIHVLESCRDAASKPGQLMNWNARAASRPPSSRSTPLLTPPAGHRVSLKAGKTHVVVGLQNPPQDSGAPRRPRQSKPCGHGRALGTACERFLGPLHEGPTGDEASLLAEAVSHKRRFRQTLGEVGLR